MGPSASGNEISIPTSDAGVAGVPGDDQGWANGTRSPGRTQGDHPPRRSSRSRSPAARDADRGYASIFVQFNSY